MERGEVESRLDSSNYRPQFRTLVGNLNRIYAKPLGSLAAFSEETWDKSDGRFNDVFPYIEISGVDLGIDEYFVAEVSVSEAPSRARQVVRANDILISLTRPHRGAVIRVLPEHEGAIASTGFAVVRDVDTKLADREYLRLCLIASFGCNQMLMRSSGGNYPAITRDELSKVLIPDIPLDRQERLVAAMDAARAERKAKLAEADALLGGVDDFVLDALGIAPPPADKRRVFGARLSPSGTPGQLNADYHHPERILALRSLNDTAGAMQSAALSSVVEFIRIQLKSPGKNYLSLAHVQSHTGELTGVTDTAAGTCYTYQVDDVLFSRLRPYLNKVYRAEMDGCCSTEFHVLRVIDRDSLLPDYLSAILRSRPVLAQTVHMMAGNTHPRLTDEDVANLRIPIPTLSVQQTIAAEVIRRRETARRLRAEAETGWQEAKGWFEERLLGAGA